MSIGYTIVEYAVSETQTLQKDDTASILIYLWFSETGLGFLLQEESDLVG